MSVLGSIFSKITSLFGLLESPSASYSEKAEYRRQISKLEKELEKYKYENEQLRLQVEQMQVQLKEIREENKAMKTIMEETKAMIKELKENKK